MTPDSSTPELPEPSARVDPAAVQEDALSAYLDDELDADARAAVEIRLEQSAEWRDVLAELRETRDALRALPEVDGSPEFWTNVFAGDAVVDLGTERRARRRGGWRVAVAGVAAAVAVITVGVAIVPERTRVAPAVVKFTDAHATRASLDDDPLSNLASVGVPGFNR
jgi:anti-sigma factor RsiW